MDVSGCPENAIGLRALGGRFAGSGRNLMGTASAPDPRTTDKYRHGFLPVYYSFRPYRPRPACLAAPAPIADDVAFGCSRHSNALYYHSL